MFIYGYSDQQYNPKDVYGKSKLVPSTCSETILPHLIF